MPSKNNTPILILVGPTGSGKTAVGLALAKKLNADIISADSRQIYKYLSAGTSKPEGEWRVRAVLEPPLQKFYSVQGVPHHLMDFLEPTEIYNAGLFVRQAEGVIDALSASRPVGAVREPPRHSPVVIVGGTGLYLRALVDGLAPLPPRDENIRRDLMDHSIQKGRKSLYDELVKVDPVAAKAIPPNNIARVIRALEIYQLTGQPISRWQKEKTRPSPRPFAWFGLRWPKEVFEKHLAERCRKMVPGILEETSSLLKRGVPADAPAFLSLGYRQALAHVLSKISRSDLEEEFIHETRLYAKRQMTWFRANKRIHWFDVKEGFDPIRVASDIIAAVPAE